MARTSSKVTKTATVAVNEVALASADAASRELTLIQSSYGEERDLMNQLLGQAQMADAFGKFSQTVWSSKLAYVKENKLYRGLSGKKSPNGLELTGTWAEFCGLLGISDEKANQDIENLRNFGEEALESMGRMGIGYREMRQYRKLPDDDKSALLEVAKTGDKDAFIDLAETILAKHQKEKADLQAKIVDSEADHKATEKVLVGRTETLNKVQKSLEKLQLRTAAWDDRVAPFKEEITNRQSLIDKAVGSHLEAIVALDSWLTVELPNQPGYDPESANPLPVEVLTVILHLSDVIDRTATLVANAQFELRNRFGGDIDLARTQLLAEPV
jgi:hypothetical protein